MAEWHIEALSSHHDRSRFTCGKPSLDDFLLRIAGQYERRGLGRTFVAVLPEQKRIDGYYTLASGVIEPAIFPNRVSKKLPRHPIPVAHLGRLAVDTGSRGQRLGEFLLIDALRRSVQSAEQLGIFAVEVFAIDNEAKGFYLKYGFQSLLDDTLHLYLHLDAVKKLLSPPGA